VWHDDDNELQEKNNPAIQIYCILNREEFEENNKELSKNILQIRTISQ